VLSVRWILVVPRRHPGSPLRARRLSHIVQCAQESRTRSGSARFRLSPSGKNKQGNALNMRGALEGRRAIELAVSSAAQHGISIFSHRSKLFSDLNPVASLRSPSLERLDLSSLQL
jgi:hypothetical protein